MEMNLQEDKIKELQLSLSLGQRNNTGGGLAPLDSLGREMDEVFDNLDIGARSHQENLANEEAKAKSEEDFKRLQAAIESLKEGHKKFKLSANQNIQNLTEKVSALTNENLALKTDSSVSVENLEKAKAALHKEAAKAEVLSKKVAELEQKNGSLKKNDDSTIAGEMLQKVLKLENQANKYKYKSEKLSQSLLDNQIHSQKQINLIYSVIFDMVASKQN